MPNREEQFTDEWLTIAGFEWDDEADGWYAYAPVRGGKKWPLHLEESGVWFVGRVDLPGISTRDDLLSMMRMLEIPVPEIATPANKCNCGKPSDGSGYCDDCFGG